MEGYVGLKSILSKKPFFVLEVQLITQVMLSKTLPCMPTFQSFAHVIPVV